MSSREEFEKWLEVRGVFFFDEDSAWQGWEARDAEVAAKDARIAVLEAALYCENSPYEAKTHRCVHCDEEVKR